MFLFVYSTVKVGSETQNCASKLGSSGFSLVGTRLESLVFLLEALLQK